MTVGAVRPPNLHITRVALRDLVQAARGWFCSSIPSPMSVK
jgi:hypothetical protein